MRYYYKNICDRAERWSKFCMSQRPKLLFLFLCFVCYVITDNTYFNSCHLNDVLDFQTYACLLFSAALVYHVPQFLERCGSISIFNCQPVEKKNHEKSRMFHRATQKGGRNSHYTRRVMEKENRKIFASVNDLYRTKRMYQKTYNDEDRNESAGSIRMYDINDIEEGWDLFTKTYTDNNLQSEMILQKSCSNRIQST